MFKLNEKYTLFRIGGFATTICDRIKIKEVHEDYAIFQFASKRKLYTLLLNTKCAVFKDWETKYTCDSDSKPVNGVHTFNGNACYNFVGSALEIRNWIDNEQLNPKFEKHLVLAVNGDNETVVYPELVTPGEHAIIDRALNSKKE